jgi:hypothetical protein
MEAYICMYRQALADCKRTDLKHSYEFVADFYANEPLYQLDRDDKGHILHIRYYGGVPAIRNGFSSYFEARDAIWNETLRDADLRALYKQNPIPDYERCTWDILEDKFSIEPEEFIMPQKFYPTAIPIFRHLDLSSDAWSDLTKYTDRNGVPRSIRDTLPKEVSAESSPTDEQRANSPPVPMIDPEALPDTPYGMAPLSTTRLLASKSNAVEPEGAHKRKRYLDAIRDSYSPEPSPTSSSRATFGEDLPLTQNTSGQPSPNKVRHIGFTVESESESNSSQVTATMLDAQVPMPIPTLDEFMESQEFEACNADDTAIQCQVCGMIVPHPVLAEHKQLAGPAITIPNEDATIQGHFDPAIHSSINSTLSIPTSEALPHSVHNNTTSHIDLPQAPPAYSTQPRRRAVSLPEKLTHEQVNLTRDYITRALTAYLQKDTI